jgi:hypothetical protein
LLVEVLQCTWRMLSEIDQARYADDFQPYVQGTSGQYIYHIRSGQGQQHLTAIGVLMQRLVADLVVLYEHHETYQLLVRVFNEHFVVDNHQARLKQPAELGSGNLQSPYDPDATYRFKQGEGYQGYVTSVTETCHPDNAIQLIVKVQTAPNLTDDGHMLAHTSHELAARTDVEAIYTDGGYNGPLVDKALQEYQIEQYQSGIRGGVTRVDRLGLSDFVFERSKWGKPLRVQCPEGQAVIVQTTYTEGRYRAAFAAQTCTTCPLLEQCPTVPVKSQPQVRHVCFGQQQVNIAHRHANQRKLKEQDHNPRSAVEATMRSIKHPFRHGKLPVRGRIRMSMMLVASAAMINIRRIWRYTTNLLPVQPVAAVQMADTPPSQLPIPRFRICCWHLFT